jgi:uncharacterized repeat protein (TIGR01451 family)
MSQQHTNTRGTDMLWKRLGTVALAIGLAVFAGGRAEAQTPEGTVIRNIARVNFTDANNNAYAQVADTVDLTVGFVAGVNTTGAATLAPASPSTGNVASFTITNLGNGTDSVTVSEGISVAGVITVTGYRYSGTTYATLAALNTALSAVAMAQGANIVVDILYDVPSGKGGLTTSYTLTAASRRTPAVNDPATTAITPAMVLGVSTTPDGAQNLQHLPTNAAAPYSFTFTVTNSGNGTESFNLVASAAGSAIAIVSVNGTPGSSASVANVAAGASASVVVLYTIANVAAGTVDTLQLLASANSNAAVNDAGFADLTVIRPALAIAKEAWDATRTAQIAGTVAPGDFIEYRIQVTNAGAAPAASVVVTDALPAEVSYVSNADPGGSWQSITQSAGTVTATLNGTLAPGASAFFWVRVQVL